MTGLTDLIKRHQVAAFYITTFAITWGLGFSYGSLLKQGQVLLAPLAFLATCGPGLAGIIISAACNTQPRQGSRRVFWIGFITAWVLSALAFLAHSTFVQHVTMSTASIGLIAVAVLPVVFLISATHSRIPAVRSYLSSLIQLRGIWGWTALALILPPASVLLSVPISILLGRSTAIGQFPDTGLALVGRIAVKFFYQLFFFNAAGEETGWRGFALPRLQTRTSVP